MKDNFNLAMLLLFQFEGHTSNLAGDTGGRTIWGISEKSHPDDVLKMVDMSPDDAKQYSYTIYKNEYWDALRCDDIQSPLDVIVFDTAVNCGVHTARKILAETRDWKDYIFKRLFYYSLLVAEKPQNRDFLRGWLNRCLSLWIKFK